MPNMFPERKFKKKEKELQVNLKSRKHPMIQGKAVSDTQNHFNAETHVCVQQ